MADTPEATSGGVAAGRVVSRFTEASITELAERYGVSRSTVSRALRGGRAGTRPEQRPDEDQVAPAVTPQRPEPVNPGSKRPRYRIAEVDAWWPHRPGVGAPVRKAA